MDRREFIRIVTSIFASHTLLATMTTRAMDEKLILQGDAVAFGANPTLASAAAADSEIIHVSNIGKNLILDVTGTPGRYVVILYQLATKAGGERIFIHETGQINKTGTAGFAIKMAKSLDQDIPFMVVTSDSKNFDSDNRGTDWFNVRIDSTQAESGRVSQNYGTDPEGPHQKVVLYAVIHLQRRSFAPLKRR